MFFASYKVCLCDYSFLAYEDIERFNDFLYKSFLKIGLDFLDLWYICAFWNIWRGDYPGEYNGFCSFYFF